MSASDEGHVWLFFLLIFALAFLPNAFDRDGPHDDQNPGE